MTDEVWKEHADPLARRVEDLRSRLDCVVEASSWDRPYEERLDAIRGMCDLEQTGFTPKPAAPAPAEIRAEAIAYAADIAETFEGIEPAVKALRWLARKEAEK